MSVLGTLLWIVAVVLYALSAQQLPLANYAVGSLAMVLALIAGAGR